MQLKNLFADEDAVSPVIGVILMVAITVILAAVIGAFVLGIGGSQEKVPQASISFSQTSTSGVVEATHEGGDPISSGTMDAAYSGSCTDGSDVDDGSTYGSEWSAGSTLEVATSCTDGDSVSLVWSSQQSDKTSVLGEFEYGA
ncbi:type IV pilin N-terminal domain-containing protein [Halorubellus litoreus]|uniref:Type IV pilin N-terminal domain-containing protein n=1 Tax=Halorubellus litoreus TaxID=755308 RepID=A0ABD5VIS7_9EURY